MTRVSPWVYWWHSSLRSYFVSGVGGYDRGTTGGDGWSDVGGDNGSRVGGGARMSIGGQVGGRVGCPPHKYVGGLVPRP